MHAYVDETGNTGGNLFDENQPEFMTAALITKDDFDTVYGQQVNRIAKSIGEAVLHANLLGGGMIELVAGDLLELFEQCQANFFVSSVNKSYLVTAKLVDTLFDSYENKAVPWHVYNFRPLRLLMVFKVGSILTEDIAKKFMVSILEKNEHYAYQIFSEALSELKRNVPSLPDKRTRQLIDEAIDWAQNNPEAIYLHTNSKAIRKGHLPNMVVFPNLLRGIDQVSVRMKLPVREIVHDRQNEFQEILREWHRLFSNAAPDVVAWPGEEPFSLQCVAGSEFRISSSGDSAGIQVVDVVLWIFKQFIKGEALRSRSKELLLYVFRHGHQHALSFESVERDLEEYFGKLFSVPMTNEDVKRARALFDKSEMLRQKNMLQHAIRKIQDNSDDVIHNGRAI